MREGSEVQFHNHNNSHGSWHLHVFSVHLSAWSYNKLQDFQNHCCAEHSHKKKGFVQDCCYVDLGVHKPAQLIFKVILITIVNSNPLLVIFIKNINKNIKSLCVLCFPSLQKKTFAAMIQSKLFQKGQDTSCADSVMTQGFSQICLDVETSRSY